MSGPKIFSDDYLEDNGIDAEEVKSDYGYGSEVDIYNGETITFRDKNGNFVEDTGMNKDEFFECYGNENKKEEYYE